MKSHFILLVFLIFLLSLEGCKESRKEKAQKKAFSKLLQLEKAREDSLRISIAGFAGDSCFRNAGIGLFLVELKPGNTKVLANINADLSLVPASVLKIMTTATALEVLGGSKSFSTSLQYSGQITGRVLKGNLFIRGGGDPAFTAGKAYSRWADAVKELGIDTIEGNIIGDARIFERFYIPSTWTWGELNSAYSAAASGLSINGNIYALTSDIRNKKPYSPSREQMKPCIPEMQFQNLVYEADIPEDNLYASGDPHGNYKYILGGIPKGKNTFTYYGTIPDPPAAACSEFISYLQQKGIFVKGKAVNLVHYSDSSGIEKIQGERIAIAHAFSPSVATLVNITNQESNNFFAEHLIKHLGLYKYHNGSDDGGSRAIVDYWKNKGMDTGGLFIFDGCGISRYNAITARQLVFVLEYMQKSPYFSVFYNSLPLAGVSGTLRNMFKETPVEGNLRAKTGTMSRVKTLAGYVRTRHNKTLAFAIIINNFSCSQQYVKERLEKLVNRMAED